MKKVLLVMIVLFASGFCFSQETDGQNSVMFNENESFENEMIDFDSDDKTKTKDEKKIDIVFQFYLPSFFRLVTGDNPMFCLRENTAEVESSSNFMFESRFSIIPINNISLSGSISFGGYVENNKNTESLTALHASLGIGAYYHIKDIPTYHLSGISMYLYPMYQMPVYSFGYKPYYIWKCAVDFGFNFSLLKALSIYPYFRQIMTFAPDNFGYAFDFGVAVGFYFHDFPKIIF